MVTTVCFVTELLLVMIVSLSLQAVLPVLSQSICDSLLTAANCMQHRVDSLAFTAPRESTPLPGEPFLSQERLCVQHLPFLQKPSIAVGK